MAQVLVLGAGTAGLTAAWLLALRGIDVVVVDRRPPGLTGARWINGVEWRMFDRLDLGDPPADLIHASGGRFVVHAGPCDTGPTHARPWYRQVVAPSPLHELDMDALQRWLLSSTLEAGADVRHETAATLEGRDGTHWNVRLAGEPHRFDVVIDASGFVGSALQLHIADRPHVCSAWQSLHPVRDREGAAQWLERTRTSPNDILSMTGIEGGWSVLNVSVDPSLEQVAILSGAIHGGGRRSGSRIAEAWLAQQDWVGPKVRSGAGLIPLIASTPSTWVEPGLVRIGDAVGQVFPLHGSGIATGMRAASTAANAVAAALQLGDLSPEGLWPAVVGYQQTVGHIADTWQPLRCFTQSLDPHEVELLVGSGILQSHGIAAGLAQRAMPVDPRLVLSALRHARDLAPLLPRVARMLTLTARLQVTARRVPTRYRTAEVRHWEADRQALLDQAYALAKPRRPIGPPP